MKVKVVEATPARVRIESGDITAVDLPIDGSGLVAGIRPEDIALGRTGGIALAVRADFFEHIGRETAREASTGTGVSLTALIGGRFSAERGGAIAFGFDPTSSSVRQGVPQADPTDGTHCDKPDP